MVLLAQVDAPTLWQFVLVGWLFCIGAAIGSFLNVVIYRVPLGISVVYPPSHCPSCKRPIRAFDNLPIVSWLILRGRCRQCGARFSGRYALVELGIALLFAAFAALVLAPRWPEIAAMAADRNVALAWSRWGLFIGALAALWTAALIEHDGHRSPVVIPAAVISFGIVATVLLPGFYDFMRPFEMVDKLVDRQFSGALGIVIGALAATLLAPRTGDCKTPHAYRSTAILWAAATGAAFGWQIILVGMIASALWFLAVRRTALRPRAHRDRMLRLIARLGFVRDDGRGSMKQPAAAGVSWLVCFAEAQTAVALVGAWYGLLHRQV